MESITVEITKQERQISFTRVVNSMIEELTLDYEHIEDVMELLALTEKIDKEIGLINSKKMIEYFKSIDKEA